MTFSVPDLLSARSRFEKLGVTIEDLQIPHTQLIVLRDPDNYPIQIMSQDFDLHAELHDVCRNVVVEGLSLIHISEPTRQCCTSRMPSSA